MTDKYQLSETGAELSNKLTQVYGGIHAHANATAQTIANGATYVKIINFDDNDATLNVTSDYANNEITTVLAGDYQISGSFSFTSSNNKTAFGGLFVDGIEEDSVHWTRKVGVASDIGSASFTGLISLTAGQVLDMRARHNDTSPEDFTFSYMNLNIIRVGI